MDAWRDRGSRFNVPFPNKDGTQQGGQALQRLEGGRHTSLRQGDTSDQTGLKHLAGT